MAFGNVNYDTLLSTTLANHAKELTDNVFKHNVLLWWFDKKSIIEKNDAGGTYIVEPLLAGEGQANSYGEWDALSLTPQGGITGARFDWRQLYASIVISGLQEFQNKGKFQMVKLLKAKTDQASKTMAKKLNTMAWSDGTGNSGKDWQGLPYLIGSYTAGGTFGPAVVGGIDTSDTTNNAWWQSKTYDKTAVSLGTGSTSKLTSWLTTAFNDSADGNEHVDAIFMGQALFEHYESTLTPNVRYEDTEAANAGFTTLRFKQVPVYMDKTMPAQSIYGVNSKYIALEVAADRWMAQSPFSDPLSAAGGGTGTTVDARYATITSYGNFKTNDRSKHFRIAGAGATA